MPWMVVVLRMTAEVVKEKVRKNDSLRPEENTDLSVCFQPISSITPSRSVRAEVAHNKNVCDEASAHRLLQGRIYHE